LEEKRVRVSEVGEEKIRDKMMEALSGDNLLKVDMACFMFLLRVSIGQRWFEFYAYYEVKFFNFLLSFFMRKLKIHLNS